jgi:hypothetical protein
MMHNFLCKNVVLRCFPWSIFKMNETSVGPFPLAWRHSDCSSRSVGKTNCIGSIQSVLQEIPTGNPNLRPRREREMRYATGPGNGVYHLVLTDSSETLCGLRVSRLRSEHFLHLESDISSEGVICKHCERIKDNKHNYGQ